VIVLAALGLDDVIAAPARRGRAVWGAVAVLAMIAVAALGARPLAHELGGVYSSRPYFEIAVAWAILVVVGLALIGTRWTGTGRGAALCAVVAVDVLAMFGTAELSAPRSVTVDTAPVAYLREHLGEGRFFTLGPLAPNYGSYFGIASANINDLPIPSLYSKYIRARLDRYVNPTVFVGSLGGRNLFYPGPGQELLRNLAGYRAVGVSYILTPRSQLLGSVGGVFTLVDRTATTNIYRLSGAAPYFSAAGCSVRSTARQAATVSCSSPSTLVRLETDMPGWNADVDGHHRLIRRSGDLFQSVPVSAGTHTIRFSYRPPNILLGELAFVGGIVLLVATGLGGRRRRMAREARPAAPAGAGGV
jgi:hypothetical protein